MTTYAKTDAGIELHDAGFWQRINGTWHEKALWAFMAVVIAHWAEHIIQGAQIWLFDMERADSLGGLGYFAPWLVSSEALHFGFAIVMLSGLIALRPGFHGKSRKWWDISLALQGWHFVEHSVLLAQVIIGTNLFGSPVPTSLLQPFVPRAELHLFYNLIVFAPMVVAMWLHTRPDQDHANGCTCATPDARGQMPEASLQNS